MDALEWQKQQATPKCATNHIIFWNSGTTIGEICVVLLSKKIDTFGTPYGKRIHFK